MDMKKHRKKLVEMEQELVARLRRLGESGREQITRDPLDPGDESVFSQFREDLFAQTDRLGQMLENVREALQRIEDGTYGECVEDGEMIGTIRLDAVPWTPYCLKHQSMRDELQTQGQGIRGFSLSV